MSPSPPQSGQGRAFLVEDFLQSLTSQLDSAQDILAMKVRGTGRPLTWALKDLTVDLKVFVEMDQTGKVKLRNAGPNEEGASTLHLGLTTITRPMVEENTWSIHEDSDPRSLEDLRQSANLDEQDQRRLSHLGVRTIGQLKHFSSQTDPRAVEAMIGIPAIRLRAALEAASRPTVISQETLTRPDGSTYLRIHGANLSDGVTPEVRLAGDPVEVVESSPKQLLVRPLSHHQEGQVEVLTAGQRATGFFRLPTGTTRKSSGGGG